jgi:hypothetical protein
MKYFTDYLWFREQNAKIREQQTTKDAAILVQNLKNGGNKEFAKNTAKIIKFINWNEIIIQKTKVFGWFLMYNHNNISKLVDDAIYTIFVDNSFIKL